jgi:hypothetical protein
MRRVDDPTDVVDQDYDTDVKWCCVCGEQPAPSTDSLCPDCRVNVAEDRVNDPDAEVPAPSPVTVVCVPKPGDPGREGQTDCGSCPSSADCTGDAEALDACRDEAWDQRDTTGGAR